MTQSVATKPETTRTLPPSKARVLRPKAILEFLAFLIVGMLILEPLLSLAGCGDEEKLDIDPITGWTLMPNRTYTCRDEAFSRVHINSHGMRDVERSTVKPANTFRIAVVGCSLTEGEQVNSDQTYCQVLEKQLNEHSDGRIFEVLNFGVSAYSLGQEYLRLKHMVFQFNPDLVIFSAKPNSILYMGYDPRLGFVNARPFFGVDGDGKLIEDRNYQKLWLNSASGVRMQNTRWLRYHSRSWGLVSKCAEGLGKFQLDCRRNYGNFVSSLREMLAKKVNEAEPSSKTLGSEVSKPTAPTNKILNDAMKYLGRAASALIVDARNECRKRNVRFMVLYMPTTKKNRDAFEEPIFKECVDKNKISYMNANTTMDALERRTEKPFYLTDHMSAEGHRATAQQLFKFLSGSDLLK